MKQNNLYRESAYRNNPYGAPGGFSTSVAEADLTDRLQFIRWTYFHLAAAVISLILIEFVLFNVFSAQLESFVGMISGTAWSWLVVLGAFMVVSWVADRWARSGSSRAVQYAGLGLYVVAQAVILSPLLYIANLYAPGAIQTAAVITGVIFSALTIFVFVTRKDFSFLRNILMIGGFAAMALIVVAVVVPGFGLGVNNFIGMAFAVAMVALASGYILFQTSNMLHHYHTDQYVAAALALFSSIGLLFWYILQLVMSFSGE